jgi:hypothetical protein
MCNQEQSVPLWLLLADLYREDSRRSEDRKKHHSFSLDSIHDSILANNELSNVFGVHMRRAKRAVRRNSSLDCGGVARALSVHFVVEEPLPV